MNKTMPALVNFALKPHSVEMGEVPVPEIGPEDVLLAVKAVGVCGSDLHQYQGKQSWKGEFPRHPGTRIRRRDCRNRNRRPTFFPR